MERLQEKRTEMSKRKAQAVAAEHGFTLTTTANREEIMSVLSAAGQAVAPGGIKGSINKLNERGDDAAFATAWELRGPGGVVRVLDFTVAGKQSGEKMRLSMEIGSFKYQKAPLPGMKPTLNGSKQVRKFTEIVKTQLA